MSGATHTVADLAPCADDLARLRREDVPHPVIFIGTGTCGLGAGAAAVQSAAAGYLAAREIKGDAVGVGCIGLCAFEPLMDVQLPGRPRLCFGSVAPEEVAMLLDGALAGNPDTERALFQFSPNGHPPWERIPRMEEHPFFAAQTRRVLCNCGLIDPGNLDEYLARGGYGALHRALESMTPEQVGREVEASGLRGRGGGGFPTGRKWALAREATGDTKYLICNADEGDPGAFMDRAVIEGDPHRLLEGMVLAAYAVGAQRAYIYIRAEYPLAIERLRQAIAQAEARNLLGEKILGSAFSLEMRIKMGAGAFVCGEETALIHSIEGQRGMPSPRPPYPAVSGLFGRPTVINNVETLANVPAIIDRGARWFQSVGTEESRGTKVFALSGKVAHTGLVEVAMGTKLREVIYTIGGGIPDGKALKAVQIGGPSGGCIPASHLETPVDYESLTALGAMMGSGGLVVMDEDNCMVDVAKFFMDFIQRESCGKCIPCRVGTKRMLEALEAITRPHHAESDRETLERFRGVLQIEELARIIQDTSLCGLGKTAPNPVLSTLRWFRDEYEEHIYQRRCPARVCAELLVYAIDPEKCIGCTACVKACPQDAILGHRKAPHHIVVERCIGCGACKSACRFDAVTVE